jgi:type VI protein secretion system component VasF
MITQHTPGPWRHDAEWGLVKHGKTEIAALHSGNAANAALIAAAPDLLDALQRFVTACDAHLPEPTHQAFCGLFASARAAIAKATGEA